MSGIAGAVVMRGIWPAVWVPLTKSREFDKAACLEHVHFLKKSGVHGFMLMGTTAEFARFDNEERKAIAEFLVEAVAPFPVMLNISHPGFHNAVDLARHAKSLGVAAISALPPYYFKISQPDLTEFLVELGHASALPLVLYNFPELAGVRIGPGTIAAVCTRTEVAAFKQSGSEDHYHPELCKLAAAHKFSLLTGFDLRLAEVLGMGGAGCVSGLANAVPEFLVETFKDPGNAGGAAKLQQFFQMLSPLEFPLNIAAGIEARGFTPGVPKTPIAPETLQTYRKVVASLKEWFIARGMARA